MDKTHDYKNYVNNISNDNPFYKVHSAALKMQNALGRKLDGEREREVNKLWHKLNLEQDSPELKYGVKKRADSDFGEYFKLGAVSSKKAFRVSKNDTSEQTVLKA